MSITVRKDPTRRLGGWALIGFQGQASAVSMIVERDGGTLFLGPHGWQSAPHQSAPYKVETGPGGAFIRVGPEIVNHLEPYIPVTIKLPEAGIEETLSWPDEVIPSPDAFEGGGVQGNENLMPQAPHLRNDRAPEPVPTDPVPPSPPKPPIGTSDTERGPVVPPPPETPPPPQSQPRGGSPWPWFALVLLLFIGAGAAGYLYWEEITGFIDESVIVEADTPDNEDPIAPPPEDPVTEEPETVAEDPEPPTIEPQAPSETATPRSNEAVAPPADALGPPACDSANAAAEQAPERLLEVMRLCRQAGNVPVEVEALDRLPASGDTDLRWGQIYDPSREEDGRPFRLNADSALRSYKRALGRGTPEVEAEIARLCAWLADAGGVSNQAIFARHCE